MSNDSVIRAKVEQVSSQNEMFTSVDIGNLIKDDGIFIRNREIAAWLRQNALSVLQNYCTTLIDVITPTGPSTAFLYYPIGSDSNDYKRTNQQALPPKNTAPFSQAHSTNTTLQKIKVRSDNRARLRIPACLVNQLGWNPGDQVDNSKIVVNGTESLNDGNIVHNDGRISFRRCCVDQSDGPVLAYVENGKLHFEKP